MFFVKFFFFTPFFRRTQTTSSLKLKLTLRKQSGTVDGNFLRHFQKKKRKSSEREATRVQATETERFFLCSRTPTVTACRRRTHRNADDSSAPHGIFVGLRPGRYGPNTNFAPKNPPTRNKTRNKDLQVFQPRERKTSLLRHKQFPPTHPPKKCRSVALLTSNGLKNRGGEVRSLHISSYTV